MCLWRRQFFTTPNPTNKSIFCFVGKIKDLPLRRRLRLRLTKDKRMNALVLLLLMVANALSGLPFSSQPCFESDTVLGTATDAEHHASLSEASLHHCGKMHFFSIISEEVSEEKSKQKAKSGQDIPLASGKALFAASLILEKNIKISAYFKSVCLSQVPLYTLFHSWKAFLIFL